MGTLVAAYVVVWLFVGMYVAWLGVRQKQLEARLGELESQMTHAAEAHSSMARAA